MTRTKGYYSVMVRVNTDVRPYNPYRLLSHRQLNRVRRMRFNFGS